MWKGDDWTCIQTANPCPPTAVDVTPHRTVTQFGHSYYLSWWRRLLTFWPRITPSPGCYNIICRAWLQSFLTPSLQFNGLFPGGPRLACSKIVSILNFIGARMMEIVVTTGAIRRAMIQSNHHHQQTSTLIFTGRMPFLLPNRQCQSTDSSCRNTYLHTVCDIYMHSKSTELQF